MFKFIKSSFSKVKGALTKTSSLLQNKIHALFKGNFNEETLDQLEQILYEADLGVKMTQDLIQKVREEIKKPKDVTYEQIIQILQKELIFELSKMPASLVSLQESGPLVILVVGVNGCGKTTSIAKLANLYKKEGKKVLIAAADTFRAAAVEQLELWAKKLDIDIVKSKPGSDPSAVIFDAITAGIARKSDLVIVDTAGRLQSKTDLMQELQKIRRVCMKVLPNAPHETLLVLDASIGQNALDQAKTFHQFTPLTGIILTKLDGSPKGGIVIAINKELNIPVKLIGVGEGIDDLEPFNAETFASALLT